MAKHEELDVGETNLEGANKRERDEELGDKERRGEPIVDSKTLKVRRTEARLKKLDPPAQPVLQLIRQDMEVLLGLSVDGELVIGRSGEDWGPLCDRLLGIVSVPGVDRKGGKLWGWERERLGTRERPPGSPLGARWDDHFHSLDLATHVVGYYRNYFDMKKPDEVVWRPYSEELIASLPPNCCAGRAIWMAKVPLLNFPMLQPPHGKDWKAGQKDYRQDHGAELEMWNNRLDHIVPAGEADPHEYAYLADDPYVTWYKRITIQYISRLSGGADKAMRLFERLRTMQTMEDIDFV
ncbi:hypothetical protein RHGRI_014998 [Rhododendron griersonianum]|uniref:Aminotransferase-like plant mobile domain-containing protein n=1 Tax=Rhododendron griersonianum TaxID=479676 RepID=A0AAV6KBK3_9ERIC|nr:hypothetical protein RHGRI_014998 [Rhododendron griersonianum]